MRDGSLEEVIVDGWVAWKRDGWLARKDDRLKKWMGGLKRDWWLRKRNCWLSLEGACLSPNAKCSPPKS
jgi:hypothetical protein